MAVGNTFGATALSSYGGFWISFAILLTPGGFAIEDTVVAAGGAGEFLYDVSFFLFVSITFLVAEKPMLTVAKGMVHLHLCPSALHSEVDTRLLPALLHPRPGLPHVGHRLLRTRLRCTSNRLYSSWWCFWCHCSIPRLVQRFGRYCGYIQQLLHHSCHPLPMVGEGQANQTGGAVWQLRCYQPRLDAIAGVWKLYKAG